MKRSKEAFILDATAFFSGFESMETEELYTTPEIMEEVSGNVVVNFVMQSGRIKVLQASSESFSEVKEKAKRTGDYAVLSKADLSILALALDLRKRNYKAVVVSDDYAVQNVARALGIEYKGYLFRGIEREVKWVWYCKMCKKVYGEYRERCDLCGGKLVRRGAGRLSREKQRNAARKA